jgi:nitroreductase
MENIPTNTITEQAEKQLVLLKKRRSTVNFSEKSVQEEELKMLFEAARWSASSRNEQPWRFIVATKNQPEAYQKILNGINEHNRVWAHNAPVLILTFAKSNVAETSMPNNHSWHDVGLAIGNMSAQATAMDIYLHQMGGILPKEIYNTFDLPEEFEVVSAIALGYLGDEDKLDPRFEARENKERVRKPLDEFVFGTSWGEGKF